jgi:hypothetical protein
MTGAFIEAKAAPTSKLMVVESNDRPKRMKDECGVAWFDKVVTIRRGCHGRHFCGVVGQHEVHCCSGCDDLFLDPILWLEEEEAD